MFAFFRNLSGAGKALTIGLVVLATSMFYSYQVEQPAHTKHFTEAPPIKKAAPLPKEEIPVEKVVVLKKDAAVKKITLPAAVADDPAKQITGTASLRPSKGGSDVVAVIDTVSGETTILSREKPLPLLGFENQKRIGMGYGYTTQGLPETKLYGEYTFIRIGNVYGSVYGEVNSGAEAKAFAHIEYRF